MSDSGRPSMMRARAASRATSVHSLAVVCTCKSAHQASWLHAYIYDCECQSGMVTSKRPGGLADLCPREALKAQWTRCFRIAGSDGGTKAVHGAGVGMRAWTTPPPLPRLPSLSMARNAWGRPIIFPSQSTTTCMQLVPLRASSQSPAVAGHGIACSPCMLPQAGQAKC